MDVPLGLRCSIRMYSHKLINCYTHYTHKSFRITDNTSLQFYVVINPNSGPSNFDSNYQACVPELLALGDNVIIVGYVLTGYGTRDSSDVLADIATYMAFPTTYRPSGIFFDETSATSEYLDEYTTYAEQVRSDVTSDSVVSLPKNTFLISLSLTSSQVILNPGTNVADTSYFSIADFIVTAEQFYDDFEWVNCTFSSYDA